MKNARIEINPITDQDIQKFREHSKRDADKLMAWVLVVELITYINRNEETLLAQTVEKIKENTFLTEDKEFMDKLNRHFSKNDISYLKRLEKNIKP